MGSHLRKVPLGSVLLAAVLLAGILLAAYGYWGSDRVALYLSLVIVGGGTIGGILRLTSRHS